MIVDQDVSFEQESKGTTRWRQEVLHFRGEVGKVLDKVVSAMARYGYSVQGLFAVRLSVEEAIVNGIRHGNHDNPERSVRVRYSVQPDRVLVQVEDEGPGFDPRDVPDPLASESLERGSGRGLLLMRLYMTSVRFNDRGNCVTLCKRHD